MDAGGLNVFCHFYTEKKELDTIGAPVFSRVFMFSRWCRFYMQSGREYINAGSIERAQIVASIRTRNDEQTAAAGAGYIIEPQNNITGSYYVKAQLFQSDFNYIDFIAVKK